MCVIFGKERWYICVLGKFLIIVINRFMFKKYFDIYVLVFYFLVIIILIFIGLMLGIGEFMEEIFLKIIVGIIINVGWLLVLVVNIFLVFLFYFVFSKMGKIWFGGFKAKFDFSIFVWFVMFFFVGMGIGLFFFSVVEFIFYYFNFLCGVINFVIVV